MEDNIDFDASPLIYGQRTLEELGDDLLQMVWIPPTASRPRPSPWLHRNGHRPRVQLRVIESPQTHKAPVPTGQALFSRSRPRGCALRRRAGHAMIAGNEATKVRYGMKKTGHRHPGHVDAGKTTLSEALLYRSGAVRKLGEWTTGMRFWIRIPSSGSGASPSSPSRPSCLWGRTWRPPFWTPRARGFLRRDGADAPGAGLCGFGSQRS